MVQISEITLQQLEGALRIDPEFYKPIFLKLFTNKLDWHSFKQISKTVDLQSNGAFKVIFETLNDGEEKTIPYIRSGNVGNFFINKIDLEKISEKAHKKLLKTHTRENDILIARKGKIGGATLVTEEDINYNTNDNVVNIRVTDKRYNEKYIVAYLNCKYGLMQIERLATGNVQPWLSMVQLRSIQIPLADMDFQGKIAKLVQDAFEQSQKSKSLYSQAEQLLLQELGLADFTPQWVAGYEADFDSVLRAFRMDAEYFQPKYEIVKERIRAVEHNTLGKLTKPLKKGIEVGSEAYTESGVPFLRVSNLSKFGIDNSNEQYVEESLFNELEDRFCPQKGEILLSKDGTPGLAYFLTEKIKTIISGGIVRLKSIEIEPEYLTLVLNSLVVQAQIEQDAGGALIKHWRPDQIKATLIPILPKSVRDKIVKMVQESFLALHESRQLLEQAKSEVEEMIENK